MSFRVARLIACLFLLLSFICSLQQMTTQYRTAKNIEHFLNLEVSLFFFIRNIYKINHLHKQIFDVKFRSKF